MNDMHIGQDVTRGQITVDASGEITAPVNIINTVSAAKSVYFKGRAEHVKRIDLYARIEGLIAGNPPYDTAELAKHGLSHIANFNTLDACSLYKKGALAFWNLLNHTENLAKFVITYPEDQGGNSPELIKYSNIMARHFNHVLRSWPSFHTLMNIHSAQLVKLGISPIYWPDERDWRWRVIDLSKFFIQDQAQSDMEQLTSVCIESFFTVQYLFEVYEKIKDLPTDGTNPWNKNELAKLLLHLANSHAKTNYEFVDFMDMQRRLQNGDIGYDAIFSDSIRIVSLLYKEYEGKISHYMFHRHYDDGDFLYRHDNQYDTIQEALVIFTASPGEFTIHSTRGLGHELFSLAQAMNQIDCSIVDTVRWSSTPMLKGLSTGSRDFEAIRFIPGVPTNIGTAEFVQNNMGANIDQMIGGSQYLLSKLQHNIANSGGDPSMPDSDKGSISASEFRARSYKEFGPLKNSIAHFYNQFDIVIQNMLSRMLHCKKGDPGYKYVAEWKRRCKDDGIPDELFSTTKTGLNGLPQHLDVKASRVAGDGSTLAKIMGLQELQFLMPTFGPKQSKAYQREFIIATLGADYLPAFMPDDDVGDEAGGGASLAGVENAIMQDGHSAVFSEDNEHESHVSTHLALGTHIIQSIQQQQMDPMQADQIFTVLVPHAAEHLAALKRSPFAQAFVSQVEKPFQQIAQYARLNRSKAQEMMQAQVRKQQEQQEQQQELMTDIQRKDMQAQSDEKRKDFKIQSQAQRAQQASDTRGELMKSKVEKDAENERYKIELENSNKRLESRDTIKRKNIEQSRDMIREMAGNTPSPNDIEGIPPSIRTR